MSVIQISAPELEKKMQHDVKLLLLDVRKSYEFEYAHIQGSQHIPMDQISQKLEKIEHNIDCVVICHHGFRSHQVATFLVSSGYTQIYNLKGGIEAWSVECDKTVLRY